MIQTPTVSKAILFAMCALAAAACLEPEDETAVAEQGVAVTKTKVVKVCGRRRSQDTPQGWWVDSGIYVAKGATITIDASAPGGGIQPWPGGTFWTPAGDATNTNWQDSLAFRSGLTAPAENVSFSLIAKVGRDGTALRVGTKKTFKTTAAGTLYLAFNDGVNFEDNLGSWNVTVSYLSAVALGSGHGTLLVEADRINTSLVDRWGIVLTAADGSGLSWPPAYVDNVVAALQAIEPRLGVPLSQVLGGVELRLSGIDAAGQTTRSAGLASLIQLGGRTRNQGTRPDDRSWGRISPPADLDYYTQTSGPYGIDQVNDKGIQNTLIHELGHMLEYRTISATAATSRMRDVGVSLGLLRMKSLTSAQDNDMDIGTFWEAQFNVTDMTEIIADSFLNWVRDSYVGMIGQIDSSPGGLATNQQRAAMYWNGGTVGTTTSPGWRGAQGFRATTSAFVTANSEAAFLRSLGSGNPAAETGGDPDPTCAF